MSSLKDPNSVLNNLEPKYIIARDLPDAWYQCLYGIIQDDGIHSYVIDKGSFEKQIRREFNMIMIHVKYPGTEPLVPDVNLQYGVPIPSNMKYVEEYLQYLLTDKRAENETYTYGERLTNPKVWMEGKEYECKINPMQEVIKMYKEGKTGTNQAIMEVGMPQDIAINDPPCLRLVDTRMLKGKLHFIFYFRSWDLWGGFPSNMAALELMKQYMCQEIGSENGSIVAMSKGLHLYDYSWEFALRLNNLSPDAIKEKLEHFRNQALK